MLAILFASWYVIFLKVLTLLRWNNTFVELLHNNASYIYRTICSTPCIQIFVLYFIWFFNIFFNEIWISHIFKDMQFKSKLYQRIYQFLWVLNYMTTKQHILSSYLFYYFWKKCFYNIYVKFLGNCWSISTKFYKYKAIHN